MQIEIWIGLFIGIGGILLGNVIEGGHLSSLFQGAAAIIVIGGTLGAVVVSNKSHDLRKAIELLRRAFGRSPQSDARGLHNEIIELAKIARKDAILALEPRVAMISNPFLRQVMQTVVDGVDPLIIRQMFEKKIEVEEENSFAGVKVWADAGGFAPTIGIIGAVLGLIHVMGNLTDTSKLGGGIAVAFVATIYGVGSANLIFLPLSNRLRRLATEESKLKEMCLEGALGIVTGLAPTVLKIRLDPYLQEEATK